MKTRSYQTMLALSLAASSLPLSAAAEESLQLYAAGSLKAALSDISTAYEKTYQIPVTAKFGPSGLLVRKDAAAKAWQLALYILSPTGQRILQDYGFEAVAIPADE
ncbi:MAG TPA: hypothetical protein PLB10_12165 [Thiolinea sp.]|nr:hypothetical protein [Thiolinea sp.]